MLLKFEPESDTARPPIRMELLVCVSCAKDWSDEEHHCETHVALDDDGVQQCECPCGLPEPDLETRRQWLWRRLMRRA
jgi:hypothetical protein